jgi:DtxR family Mn-dependent transcriptional regulator
MKLSPSLEDYLEEIYRISTSSGSARVTDIAATLNVSLPSVNKAIRKLKDFEYIMHERYGEIALTEQGKRLGQFLVERNRILQEFLNIIQADCDAAKEAEAMEHYLSDSTIDAIHKLVHFLRESGDCYRRYLDKNDGKPAT